MSSWGVSRPPRYVARIMSFSFGMDSPPDNIMSSLSVRKGASQSTDPAVAAAELRAALAQPNIKLVIFYCAADYPLNALAEALHEQFGDIALIGCTTAGEITPQGYVSGTLTGVSLAGEVLDVSVASYAVNPFNSTLSTEKVAAQLQQLGLRHSLMPTAADTFAFMLIDGLSMQEELVVSCIHQRLHGIELIGGSAADDVRFGHTYLYIDGKFHEHVALLALVRTTAPFMAFRTQHFIGSSKRMVVTRSDPANRIVYDINGKPAAPEFARLLDINVAELTPLVFATHPVVVRIDGQFFVRSVAKVNPDNSLTFFCAIDEGIVLTLATGVNMLENLQQAFDHVRSQIGPPQLVLGCDCILRRLETERTGIKEQVGEIFRDNNVVGFATYGEQYNAMHVNQTFTGIAIGSVEFGSAG